MAAMSPLPMRTAMPSRALSRVLSGVLSGALKGALAGASGCMAARASARTWACTLVALLAPLAAHADSYVVVHASNPLKALTPKEAVELFMGRSRNFPGGELALVFDLPRDGAARAAFYQALTGMTPAQVNSYWARLMFTGQTMPPQPLPNEAAMLELVKRNPSAIGYVAHEPHDKALKVVLVLKDVKDGSRDGR